ncbi:MAG: hypothetical protein QXM96_01760 [Candidatus Woesearchaeota archaeon]
MNFLLNIDKKTLYSFPIIADNLKRVIESGKAERYQNFLEHMHNIFVNFYFAVHLRYQSMFVN